MSAGFACPKERFFFSIIDLVVIFTYVVYLVVSGTVMKKCDS